jgi:NADH-quinone oxidoreductase subunit M
MVAYSSVSHMGYVVLGLGVWSATAGTDFNQDYWKMGMNGAMFQMIAHGISSAGMFFMVGVIYDRVHHRNLNEFGGLFARMPVYSGLAIVVFFAGLGLPGLCGFIGEVCVTLSVWNFSKTLAIITAAVVILTAGYILWAVQRVYLGPEYKGPHGDHITPITAREMSIAVPLVALAILFGVYPAVVFGPMQGSVDKTVNDLTVWAETHRPDEAVEVEEEVEVAGEVSARVPAKAVKAKTVPLKAAPEKSVREDVTKDKTARVLPAESAVLAAAAR